MKRKTLLTHHLCFACLCFFASQASSQTYRIACQVIASSGGEADFQGKNYAFTLGEPVIATFANAGSARLLTQGFHQPECSDASPTGVQNAEPDFQVSLFPNPTVERLWLQISPVPTGDCTVQIFDLLGQPALPPVAWLAREMLQVSVSALPPGWYVLRVNVPHTQAAFSLPFVKVK